MKSASSAIGSARTSMNDIPKRSWFRRLERWLVGLVLAIVAYLLERAVVRSIRRGGSKPPPAERPFP
jgi:hypothetical protein